MRRSASETSSAMLSVFLHCKLKCLNCPSDPHHPVGAILTAIKFHKGRNGFIAMKADVSERQRASDRSLTVSSFRLWTGRVVCPCFTLSETGSCLVFVHVIDSTGHELVCALLQLRLLLQRASAAHKSAACCGS
jgi:hypothetical protein